MLKATSPARVLTGAPLSLKPPPESTHRDALVRAGSAASTLTVVGGVPPLPGKISSADRQG